MAKAFLKVPPEDALQILEGCIVAGYRLKDAIMSDYRSDKENAQENIKNWQRDTGAWVEDTMKGLNDIYASEKEAYNFRDSETSGLYREGYNVVVSSIENHMMARLKTLNRFYDFILQQSNVQISAGGDLIMQIGHNPKAEIKK